MIWVINWFRLLFTIELKDINNLGSWRGLFIILWRFFAMGYAACWAAHVWFGITIPPYYRPGTSDNLNIGFLIFFGLCGLFLTDYVTFFAGIAGVLMLFGVFDTFRTNFIMIVGVILVMLAVFINKAIARAKGDDEAHF